MRQQNRREAYREYWWRHVEPRHGMWRALDGLTRYIATPTVAKHRLFAWFDTRVGPDHQLIVVARDDDVTFGILHSRFHELWSLRLCTWLGKGTAARVGSTRRSPSSETAGSAQRRARRRREELDQHPAGRRCRDWHGPDATYVMWSPGGNALGAAGAGGGCSTLLIAQH